MFWLDISEQAAAKLKRTVTKTAIFQKILAKITQKSRILQKKDVEHKRILT